jgi:DnaK suppressor protein
MSENDLLQLKSLLLRQRREILDRLQGLESDWRALSEPDIEREEEAQKADLAGLFDQMEERDRQELKEIELALLKMVRATYGICEKCRKPIGLERLKLLPTARNCQKCATRMEEKQKKSAVLP